MAFYENLSMTANEPKIPIAMVMKTVSIAEAMFPELQEALESLGIEISSIGCVTVSAAMPLGRFVQVFGVQPTSVQAQPMSQRDMGTPGGFRWEGTLIVPPTLEKFVKHISVVPPATRMQA